jgi:hypothetical protein
MRTPKDVESQLLDRWASGRVCNSAFNKTASIPTKSGGVCDEKLVTGWHRSHRCRPTFSSNLRLQASRRGLNVEAALLRLAARFCGHHYYSYIICSAQAWISNSLRTPRLQSILNSSAPSPSCFLSFVVVFHDGSAAYAHAERCPCTIPLPCPSPKLDEHYDVYDLCARVDDKHQPVRNKCDHCSYEHHIRCYHRRL